MVTSDEGLKLAKTNGHWWIMHSKSRNMHYKK